MKDELTLLTKTPDGLDITAMVEIDGRIFVATARHIYRLAQRRKGRYVLVCVANRLEG